MEKCESQFFSSVHCSHVLNFSHYFFAVRALVDFTQEHPDAGGATVTAAGQAPDQRQSLVANAAMKTRAAQAKHSQGER